MDIRSERQKERYKQQYQEEDRIVKRMSRADKWAYMEDVASQAEEAANRREHGQVYKITKLVSGKYRGATDMLIVDKQGRLLTTVFKKDEDAQTRSSLYATSSNSALYPPRKSMVHT